MNQLIFAIVLTWLSLSDQSAHIGCDTYIAKASECWIVSPTTGITTWITPQGITYTEAAQ
jgi:hypothetical protein